VSIIAIILILAVVLIGVLVVEKSFEAGKNSQQRQVDEAYAGEFHNSTKSGTKTGPMLIGFLLLGGLLMIILNTVQVSREMAPATVSQSSVASRPRAITPAPEIAKALEPPFIRVDPETIAPREVVVSSTGIDEEASTETAVVVSNDESSGRIATPSEAEQAIHPATPQEAFQNSPMAATNLSFVGLVFFASVIVGGVWIARQRSFLLIMSLLGGVFLLLISVWVFSYRSNVVQEAQVAQFERMVEIQHQVEMSEVRRRELTQQQADEPLSAPKEMLESASEDSFNPGNPSSHSAFDEARNHSDAAGSSSEAHAYSQPAAVAFRTDFFVVGGLISLVLLAFLIIAGIWIAHQKQHWTWENFRYSAAKLMWIAPMLAVVGWVGFLYVPSLSLSPLVNNPDYDASNVTFHRFNYDSEGDFQVATKGISPWVTNGQTSHGDKVFVPVHGGWRDSLGEARNQARQQAQRVLSKDFYASFPQAKKWSFDLNLDELDAIPRLESESREFDIAGNQTQMYRTHMQVELSNNVRGEILQRWIPRLRTFRTTVLQVLMVTLMIVFFAIGGSLSLDMRTHGAYSRWIKFASLVIVLAAGIGAYMIRETLVFSRYLT